MESMTRRQTPSTFPPGCTFTRVQTLSAILILWEAIHGLRVLPGAQGSTTFNCPTTLIWGRRVGVTTDREEDRSSKRQR